MSTERQKAANRANAQKSAGPTSAEGKSRVSSNATRHGATGRGPFDNILDYYSIIRDHVGETAQAPFDRSAWHLAEAEVQLLAARKAQQENLLEKATSIEKEAKMMESDKDLRQVRNENSNDKEVLSLLKNLKDLVKRSERLKRENLAKQERLLQRYVTEAETRRASAFKAWISRYQAK